MPTPKDPKFSFQYGDVVHAIYHVNTGEGIPKHEHAFSHVVFCANGSLLIRKEGIERVITADSKPISLKANEWHELEAIEDGTVFINMVSAGKY